MTHNRTTPMALVFSVLTFTALPMVASAATWPSHGKAIKVAASGWTLPMENDSRSYVDDGFRKPLPMAARNDTPPGLALGRMLDPRLEREYGGRAASSGAATRSMAGGRGIASFPGTGTSGGSSSGPFGLGGDMSAVAAGRVPGLTPPSNALGDPSNALADLLKPESPDPISQGSAREPGADAAVAQLVVTPLPTSAFLMIAGLGGLVPLMLRRRRRNG